MVLLKDIALLISLASFTTCNAANGEADSFAVAGDISKAPAGISGAGAKAGLPAIPEAAPDPGHIIHKAHVQYNGYKDDREHTMKHHGNGHLASPEAVRAHRDKDGEGDKGPLLQGHPANTLTVRDMIGNGLNALTERDAHPFIQAIGNVFASFGKRADPGAPTANSEAPPAVAAGAGDAAGAPAQAPTSGTPAAAGDAVSAGPAGGAAPVASSKKPGAVIEDTANDQKAAMPQGEHQHAGPSKEPHSRGYGLEGTRIGGNRKGTIHLASHRKGFNGRLPKMGPPRVNPEIDTPRKAINERGMRRRQVPPMRPYQPDNGPRPFRAPKRLGSMPNMPDTTIDFRQMRAPQMQPDNYRLPVQPSKYQKASDGKAPNNNYFPIKHAAKLMNDEALSPKLPTGVAPTSKGAEGKHGNKEAAKEKPKESKASKEEDHEEAEEEEEDEEEPKQTPKSTKPKKSKPQYKLNSENEHPNDEEDEEPTPRSKSKPAFKAPKFKSFEDKDPAKDGYDSDDFDDDEDARHSSKFHVKHEMVKQH